MAIRELFARFSFAWDQGVLGKITAASQRAEDRVRRVGKAFDQTQRSATLAKRPLLEAQRTLAVPQSVGATQTLATPDWSKRRGVLQSPSKLVSSTYTPPAWLTKLQGATVGITAGIARLRGSLAGILPRFRQIGAAFRSAFSGRGAAQAATQIEKVGDAAERSSKKTSKFKNIFRQLLSVFGIAGGALGAAFAGRMIVRSIQNTFAQVDATAKLAKQLGVTTEAMQSLNAAARISGVSTEELRTGVMAMTRNLGLFAATGQGEAVKVLKAMGVGIDEIKGRAPDQLFWEFGKALAGIEDPVKRSAFAQRIFGESGAKMLSVFHGSAEEIEALKKRTEELGIVFSNDFAKQIEKTNDEMYLAGLQFQKIKVALIGALAPALMWIAGRSIHLGQGFARLAGQSRILQASFMTGGWALFVKLLGRLFGGVGGIRGALSKLWPMLARMGRLVLPWIAWALILDDIITFLDDGDSALGRFLDHLFGAGTAKKTLAEIRKAWKQIKDSVKAAVKALSEWDEGTAAAGDAAKLMLAVVAGVFQMIAFAAGDSSDETSEAFIRATQPIADTVDLIGEFFEILWGNIASGAQGAVDSVIDSLGILPEKLSGGLFGGESGAVAADTMRRKAYRAAGGAGTGTRAAPEPRLPSQGTSGGRTVTLNDQRTTVVQVSRDASPAQTAGAVSGAVTRTQRADVRALRGALVGAGRD